MLRYGNVYTVIVNSAVDCGQHVAIDSLHYVYRYFPQFCQHMYFKVSHLNWMKIYCHERPIWRSTVKNPTRSCMVLQNLGKFSNTLVLVMCYFAKT